MADAHERLKRPAPRAGSHEPATAAAAAGPAPTQFATVPGLVFGAEQMQRRASRSDPLGGKAVDPGTVEVLRRRRSRGSRLPSDVSGSMGAAFGADFRDVRVHADDEAGRLARAMHSVAFTVGSDIYFSRGGYAPSTPGGRRLLAHELAHTLQTGPSATGAGLIVGRADDPAERDADRMADQALSTLNRTTSRRDTAAPPPAANGPVADATVRRFVSADWFMKQTYEGPLTGRSSAQRAISGLLAQYTELCSPADAAADAAPVTKKSKKKEARLRRAGTGEVPDQRVDRALALLDEMKELALLWTESHTQRDDGLLAARTKKAPAAKGAAPPPSQFEFDPSRRKRGIGMAVFLQELERERAGLLRRKSAAGGSDVPQEAVPGQSAVMQKLRKHYEGSFDSIFTRLATPLDAILPRAGDSASFSVDFKVPIPDTPVMVGGFLRFYGERSDSDSVMAQLEIAPQVAVGLPIAEVKAAIGLYVKLSGKSAADAMTMLSYALYRQMRQSQLPREIATSLWGGGGTSRYHRLKADSWSRGVEKKMWGSADPNDDAANFVELGSLAEVGASVGYGSAAELSASAKMWSGVRYDRTSMDNRKGGAGQQNRHSDGFFSKNVAERVGRGAEKRLSRKTYTLTLYESLTVGPFTGQLMGVFSMRQQGLHKKQRKGISNFQNWEFEEVSLWAALGATLPGGGAALAAGQGAVMLVDTFRAASDNLARKAEKTELQKGAKLDDAGRVGAELGAMPNVKQTAIDGLASVGGLLAASTQSLGFRLDLNAGMSKKLGSERGLNSSVVLDVKLVTALPIPELGYLEIAGERARRILGLAWESGHSEWKRGFSVAYPSAPK
ncbi:DUF4157 domain-containing protein [Phytoactinopolyspora alkaliphila]|uniref:DUF4157 domain-containing protein n=1 Tax=Phytoactinopolyspora alkaliphila TaxID=1783498 RepID=A0A6N9YFN5_9ACTN|nr:DUF4157 domain-containing protein [Phytoactinopolyspora alkaliphila]NED93737.1 DUF4157 domain-containing protein [Phytoactinopolyspora alkaliphila]